MTFKWFVAMTNHYVGGLFDSSDITLYLLQRLKVIDVGTQASTASHDAMIQFAQQQRVYIYMYVPTHNTQHMADALCISRYTKNNDQKQVLHMYNSLSSEMREEKAL